MLLIMYKASVSFQYLARPSSPAVFVGTLHDSEITSHPFTSDQKSATCATSRSSHTLAVMDTMTRLALLASSAVSHGAEPRAELAAVPLMTRSS